MRDEDKSVSIAVNGKRVRSSEHRRAVSGVMSVMRDAHALGKLGGCSEEASQDGACWGVCEWACRASETQGGCGLRSGKESEMGPEVDGETRGDQRGSAERVCDRHGASQMANWERHGVQTSVCRAPGMTPARR
jgi:hypothetical protein